MKIRMTRVICSAMFNLSETMERDSTFFNATKETLLTKLPKNYHNYKKSIKIC